MFEWQFQGRIRDSGNIRWADHVRGQGHGGIDRKCCKNVARILGQLVDILMRKKPGPR